MAYETDFSLSDQSVATNKHAKQTKRPSLGRRRGHESDDESSSSDSAHEARRHLLQELSRRASAAKKGHSPRSRRNDTEETLLNMERKLGDTSYKMDEIQRALDESSDPAERIGLARDINKLRKRIDDIQDRIEEGLVKVPAEKETIASSPSSSSPSSSPSTSNNGRIEDTLRQINKNLKHSNKSRYRPRHREEYESDSVVFVENDNDEHLNSLERKLNQFQAQRELKKIKEERKRKGDEEILLTKFRNEQLKKEAAEKEKAEKEKQREEQFRQQFIAEQRRAEEQRRRREEEMERLEAEIRDKISRERLAEELREKERKDHEQRLREQWEHERRKEESRERQRREEHEQMMKRAQEAWVAEQTARREKERKKEEDEARRAEQRAREVLTNAGYSGPDADRLMKKGSQSAVQVASFYGDAATKYRVHKSFLEPQVIADLGLKVESDPRDPLYWQIKNPLSQETQIEMFRRSKAIQMARSARASNQRSPANMPPKSRQRETARPRSTPYIFGAGNDRYIQVRSSNRRPPEWYNAL